MFDWLYKLTTHPETRLYLIVGGIVIAILLGCVCFALIHYLVNQWQANKAAKQNNNHADKALKTDLHAHKTESFKDRSNIQSGEHLLEDRPPWLSGWSFELLSRYGWLPIGPIHSLFIQLMRALNLEISGKSPRYQVPWYVLLGPKQAGKTSILHALYQINGHQPPIFAPDNSVEGLSWNLFHDGVVIETNLEEVPEATPHKTPYKWDALLSLLRAYRAKRPLDGIVLAIPASDLDGTDSTKREELALYGRTIFQYLTQAQRITGMRLPVYLIVTKSDELEGFNQFCHGLKPEFYQDLFGWSNPYSIDTHYHQDWLQQAATALKEGLHNFKLACSARNDNAAVAGSISLSAPLFDLIPGLRVLCDIIFSHHNDYTNFPLRGIYFCGTLDPTSASIPILHQRLDPNNFHKHNNNDSLYHPLTKGIVFIGNLWRHKIFPEFALGKPLPAVMINSTKSAKVASIAMATVACVLMLGGFNALHNLQVACKNITPILTQITSSFKTIGHLYNSPPNANDQAVLAQKSKELENLLPQITPQGLWSIFLLPSWFSSLKGDLSQSLGIAYDHIVLQSIYLDLRHRAAKLAASQALPAKKLQANKVDSGPLMLSDDPTFQALVKYVQNIQQLEQLANAYNSFRDSDKKVYLTNMNSQIREKFYLPFVDLKLKDPYFKPFLLDDYRTPFRHNVHRLYQHFLDVNFAPGYEPLRAKIDNTVKSVNQQLQPAKSTTSQSGGGLHSLRTMYNNIIHGISATNIIPPILAKSYELELGPMFGLLIDDIKSSELLGSEFASELLALKAHVVKTIQYHNQPPQKPLEELNFLKDDISKFFNENFMVDVVDKKFQPFPDHKENQLILWNLKVLNQTKNIIQEFLHFTKLRLQEYNPKLHPVFYQASIEHLQQLLVKLLGHAQKFKPLHTEVNPNLLEEAIKTEIKNLDQVWPVLEELVEFMSEYDIQPTATDLEKFMQFHCRSLFELTDNIFTREYLYQTIDHPFWHWQGEPNPAFQIFGAKDQYDLQRYLLAQRQRIKIIAHELFQPLLTVLSDRCISYNNPEKLEEWRLIIKALDDYEKKHPGNSLSSLENFIIKDLTNVELANCPLPIAAWQTETYDYFQENYQKLALSFNEKSQNLLLQRYTESYQKLADFYNNYLAGHFPFVGHNAIRYLGEEDAELAHIRDFLKLYKELAPQLQTNFKKFKQSLMGAEDALDFLDKIEEVSRFFNNIIVSDEHDDYLSAVIDVTAHFNLYPEHASNYNAILDWHFTSSDNHSINFHDQKEVVQWRYEQPVELGWQWVENAPYWPTTDPEQMGLSVSGRYAKVRYEGRWSLLRLIYEHQALSEDFNGKVDILPGLVKFIIPLAENHRNYQAKPPGVRPKRCSIWKSLFGVNECEEYNQCTCAPKTYTPTEEELPDTPQYALVFAQINIFSGDPVPVTPVAKRVAKSTKKSSLQGMKKIEPIKKGKIKIPFIPERAAAVPKINMHPQQPPQPALLKFAHLERSHPHGRTIH